MYPYEYVVCCMPHVAQKKRPEVHGGWSSASATLFSVIMLDGLTRARLKQQSPALGAAMWILAIAGPVLLTLIATHSSLFRGGFQFCSRVLVVTLAVLRGMRPALTA